MSNLILSETELDRILVLKEIKERFLTQKVAGKRLGLSERQVRRLLKRWADSGIVGALLRKYRGRGQDVG